MLQFHELLQIKEHVLTKCQNTMNRLTRQMKTQPSAFESADSTPKEAIDVGDRDLDADMVKIEAQGDDGLPLLFVKHKTGKSERKAGESLPLEPAKKKQQKAQNKNAKKKETKHNEAMTFQAARGQDIESSMVESPR